jgi:deoxyribodipyrimidine photo-lyase
MDTAVVLFTRDLRTHDHPALAAAAKEADRVVPLWVLDRAIVRADYNRPNRAAFLAASLADLDASLHAMGAALVTREGDVVDEVVRVVREVSASAVFVSADVSGYAQRRQRRLADALDEQRCELRLCPGITVVEPGALVPGAGGDHFRVFTPYARLWDRYPRRPLAARPRKLSLPPGLAVGKTPTARDICAGTTSPHLLEGGETAGRKRMLAWTKATADPGVAGYDDDHDDMAGDATSRLSSYLHFGCVSPREFVERAGTDGVGAQAVVRQLCWRDFHHQVLAARPDAATADYRPRGDRWRRSKRDFQAWCEGRTGYPAIDAGMRQLADEGWMHNRARLLTGNFLVRYLYLDWRLGARHFFDLLLDGDMANNTMNWQWVAGTGNDTRRNRGFNPVSQAARYDPKGEYVRRWVPELADVPGRKAHEPWTLPDFDDLGYPERIVSPDEAAARMAQRPA